MTNLTRVGAWMLMTRISRVLPIYQDDQDRWLVYAFRELEYAGVDF